MAIFSALFLLVAIMVVIALLKALLELVAKLFLAGVMTLVAATAGGFAAEAQWPGAGPLVGVAALGVCFLPSVWLVWSLHNAISRSRDRRASRALAESLAAPVALVLEPAGDERVAAAWGRAVALAPTDERKLVAARRSCAALLQTDSAGAAIEPDLIEAATLIRRHVPPLVEDTEMACRAAGPGERAMLISQLTEQLTALAARAELVTAAAQERLREQLAIRHTHVANRLREISGTLGADELHLASEDRARAAPLNTDSHSITWWSWLASPLTLRR